MITKAGIITIGNEVLYGHTLDTNAAFLGKEALSLGLAITFRATVGDELGEIAEAVRFGMRKAEVLILTGGLGPTADDVTKRAVGRLMGSRMVFRRELLEAIRQRFASRGMKMPACNRSQALVPHNALVLPNPQGTAPGLLFKPGRKLVALLPGVPREMQAIWEGSLKAILANRVGGHTAVRTVRTFGLPESAIAERLRSLEAQMPRGALAYLPSYRGVDLRIIIRDRDGRRAEDRAEAWASRIIKKIGKVVYAQGQESMEEVAGRLLRQKKLTLALAESCTGGLIGDRLTDVPGSSEYFLGGVTAYSNELKQRLLGVSPISLKRYGAVSRQTARQMARGARERLGADMALAVTGIAGPSGAVPGKPVGLVFLAVAGPHGERVEERRFVGNRRTIKEWAAQTGLDLIRRYLMADRRVCKNKR